MQKKILNFIQAYAHRIKRKLYKTKVYKPKIYTLTSMVECANKNGFPIFSAGNIEKIPVLDPPIFDGNGYHQMNRSPKMVLSNQPYVAELHNAIIYSRSSLLTVNECVLHDAAIHPFHGRFVNLQFEKAFVSRHENKLSLQHRDYCFIKHKCGIFLGGLASYAFGHWVQEFLPKLQFLEYHPEYRKFPIFVDEEMPRSHFDYLKYITHNPIICLPSNTGFICKRLLVAPTVTFIPFELIKNHSVPLEERGPISTLGLRFLRERVINKIQGKSNYGPKIYLSRRNMTWRRLINDDEIADFLKRQGFEVVNTETLNFEDQVRMFKDAKCIVAPNGSSLLNVIYANTDVKLLILSQPNLYNWGGYYGPMMELGYDMLFVLGDELQEEKQSDYRVPVERVREALNHYLK